MATREVPGSYSSIVKAINAASSGDIVNIASGTYSYNISSSVGGLIIQGATGDPRDVTIVGTGTSNSDKVVQLHTDDKLKDLTVCYTGSGNSGNVGAAPLCVRGTGGGYVKFHLENCRFFYQRGGAAGYLAEGSTVHRCWMESLHKATTHKTWAVYPTSARSGNGIIYTSCAMIDNNWADIWSGEGPVINCTISTKYNKNAGSRRGYYCDETVNCIAHINAGSTYHSGIDSEDNSIMYNNISYGWGSDGKDVVSGGTAANNIVTSTVEAAAKGLPIFINESGSSLNIFAPGDTGLTTGHCLRIISGSAAHWAGTGSYQQYGTASVDLYGRPFKAGSPSIGCFAYAYAHKVSGVDPLRVSGSLGASVTSIKTILGVAT